MYGDYNDDDDDSDDEKARLAFEVKKAAAISKKKMEQDRKMAEAKARAEQRAKELEAQAAGKMREQQLESQQAEERERERSMAQEAKRQRLEEERALKKKLIEEEEAAMARAAEEAEAAHQALLLVMVQEKLREKAEKEWQLEEAMQRAEKSRIELDAKAEETIAERQAQIEADYLKVQKRKLHQEEMKKKRLEEEQKEKEKMLQEREEERMRFEVELIEEAKLVLQDQLNQIAAKEKEMEDAKKRAAEKQGKLFGVGVSLIVFDTGQD